jgi:hypothetical protein
LGDVAEAYDIDLNDPNNDFPGLSGLNGALGTVHLSALTGLADILRC